ncbi:hypothetical protein HY489_02000 [Candidatus Woesearchaeota archaeon]|nr:hypothetical protein [Candidatus Woesearchaeota archaeon]
MKWVILLLLLSSLAFAAEVKRGDITLLALTENASKQSGSVAMLSLDLVSGEERVFLQAFPMTKIATQASLRFAQQVACKELDVDCSNYDFLFTIQALPGIVGGPSAGSSAATLTAALLLNKTVPKDVAMTGTINSGGIVGVVGGVKQKVEAASSSGIKTVVVPKGTKDVKEGNKSISIVGYGKKLNISVIEVSTFGEILELVLGVPRPRFDSPLVIDERYQRTMQDVANDLCERSRGLLLKTKNVTMAKNFTSRAEKATASKEWYAAASYCFRANVELKRRLYAEQKLSEKQLEDKAEVVRVEAEKLKSSVEARNVSTLTDLQTFMAVMERVQESLDALDGVLPEELDENVSTSEKILVDDVVYAEERLFSAVTWARFFDGTDRTLVIDESTLRAGCAAKLSEAEERYNYVKSIIPEALDGTRKDIDAAYGLLSKQKYILCLHHASKSKAEADVLLGVLGVEELSEAIDLKLSVARVALMKSQQKGVFPIIAYSYYEYANSLKDFDRVSSLLFAGYALELANLDIYFEKPKQVAEPAKVKSYPSVTGPFVLGLFAGFAVAYVLLRPVAQSTIGKRRK